MRVVVSDRADADLLDIASYLSSRNLPAALKLLDQIARSFERISSFPFSGAARPALGPDIRRLVVAPYLVFYAVRSDHVTIIRVLHGSRDIEVEFGA